MRMEQMTEDKNSNDKPTENNTQLHNERYVVIIAT